MSIATPATRPLAPLRGARPVGSHRVARWAAGIVAAALLATALALEVWLPHHTVAAHWAIAWSGLDVATAGTAIATVLLLRRDDARAALSATAGAALLVLDAWFDVTTAASRAARIVAVSEAVVFELPLAVLAGWLALVVLRGDPRARPARTRAPR